MRYLSALIAALLISCTTPAVAEDTAPSTVGHSADLFHHSLESEVAQLQLPESGVPGTLLFPDGRTFQLTETSDIQLAAHTTAAAAPAAGAAGGAGDGGGGGGAGGNGTNPAQNVTTFIVSNEYYELDGGNQISTTYARFKFPIYEGRGSVLFETPFTFYDFTSTAPAAPEIGGLADIKIQAAYNSLVSDDKKLTFINFLEFYIPSADTAIVAPNAEGQLTAFNLGTGKYVLGPGAGLVYAPQPNFIIAPLYFYEASVAGDDSREEIRRGKWRLFAMYAWESGAYVLPEFQVLTNYLNGDNDTYAAPEVGYSHKGTTLYVKPGVGFNTDPNNRQWGIEFGARVTF